MAYSDSVVDLPPHRLFKYRSFDPGMESGAPYARDRQTIERCCLWASTPLSFNDPFDCIPAIDLSGTIPERREYARRVAARQFRGLPRAQRKREQLRGAKALIRGFGPSEEQSVQAWKDALPQLGVVCLAERADDMLMWGYYSDSHRGYCLEFDTRAEPIKHAHRVIYSPERTVFRPLDPDRSQLMERTLLRKADFWAHEREWRIVSRPVGQLKYPPEALTAVILGANVSAEGERAIRESIGGRRPEIEIKRAKLDHRTFRITIAAA